MSFWVLLHKPEWYVIGSTNGLPCIRAHVRNQGGMMSAKGNETEIGKLVTEYNSNEVELDKLGHSLRLEIGQSLMGMGLALRDNLDLPAYRSEEEIIVSEGMLISGTSHNRTKIGPDVVKHAVAQLVEYRGRQERKIQYEEQLREEGLVNLIRTKPDR